MHSFVTARGRSCTFVVAEMKTEIEKVLLFHFRIVKSYNFSRKYTALVLWSFTAPVKRQQNAQVSAIAGTHSIFNRMLKVQGSISGRDVPK